VGCGKKILIPQYETAEEQFVFAMKTKTGTMKGFDEKTRKEQLRRIEASFYEVINTFPDDTKYTPAAYLTLGNTYLDYKQWKKAMDIYQEAIERYPGQEDVQLFGHYGLGVAYDRLEKYSDAREQYKICIERFGDDPRSSYQNIVEKARSRYGRIRVEDGPAARLR
jgi:tetratricopeptide (TPR) repeat protein